MGEILLWMAFYLRSSYLVVLAGTIGPASQLSVDWCTCSRPFRALYHIISGVVLLFPSKFTQVKVRCHCLKLFVVVSYDISPGSSKVMASLLLV